MHGFTVFSSLQLLIFSTFRENYYKIRDNWGFFMTKRSLFMKINSIRENQIFSQKCELLNFLVYKSNSNFVFLMHGVTMSPAAQPTVVLATYTCARYKTWLHRSFDRHLIPHMIMLRFWQSISSPVIAVMSK